MCLITPAPIALSLRVRNITSTQHPTYSWLVPCAIFAPFTPYAPNLPHAATDENKFEYSALHEQYVEKMEATLTDLAKEVNMDELIANLPDFMQVRSQ